MVSWLAAVTLPLAILAITLRLDPTLDVGGKSALFFAGVVGVALFGGVAPAVLSGLLSGALLVYFHTEPRYSFAVKSLSNALTIMILLGVAMAIAVLVDAAASRAREARRASQEAELLSLFAASVLRGADLNALLERVREAYSQRSVCLVREVDGRLIPVAGVGTESCVTVDSADTAVKVGDEEFWMLMTGRGLTGRDRRVLSVVATQAAGLVKRGELAEEAGKVKSLAEADELRRLLLSALGHDLRTPLTAAKAAVSSLRAEDVWFSPEDTSELLATVEESVDQLTLLVANLLDSSRLAAGVVRPELTEVYLEEVVQRALVGIGGRSTIYGRASIDRVKVEVGGTVAMGDAGLLERVLSNVIDNALRYAPASVVRVNAGQVGPRVLINIVDEGPGVSKGAAEQMFQPFQRLGDFDTTTGLGLGLSVAKGFVEAMDGTITATDTPGGGLTILIDMAAPLQDRRSNPADRAGDDAEPSVQRSSTVTRVLVVDDDPQLLRALRINLSVRGYEVITAPTGSRALTVAAEHPPQVVILDLGMPDISGIEVLAGLRGWLTAPVIVLSARTDSSDKVGRTRRGRRRLHDEAVRHGRAAGPVARRGATGNGGHRRGQPGGGNQVVPCRPLGEEGDQERRRGPPDPHRVGHAGNAGAQPRQAGRSRGVAPRGVGTQVRDGNPLSPCVSRAVAPQTRGRPVAPCPSADRGRHGVSLRGMRVVAREQVSARNRRHAAGRQNQALRPDPVNLWCNLFQ